MEPFSIINSLCIAKSIFMCIGYVNINEYVPGFQRKLIRNYIILHTHHQGCVYVPCGGYDL